VKLVLKDASRRSAVGGAAPPPAPSPARARQKATVCERRRKPAMLEYAVVDNLIYTICVHDSIDGGHCLVRSQM
jgi:hypothetical protein